MNLVFHWSVGVALRAQSEVFVVGDLTVSNDVNQQTKPVQGASIHAPCVFAQGAFGGKVQEYLQAAPGSTVIETGRDTVSGLSPVSSAQVPCNSHSTSASGAAQ